MGIDGTGGDKPLHRSIYCEGQQGKKGRETRETAAGWPVCRFCLTDNRMQHMPKVAAWVAWDRRAPGSSAPSSTAPRR